MRLACARVSALHRDRRQFRGSIGSDGFEKVLIGTRGAREAFLDGAKGRAAKNSVLTSGAQQLKGSGAKLTMEKVRIGMTDSTFFYLSRG